MIKYRYQIDNGYTEVLDVNDVPVGVEYEIIEVAEPNPLIHAINSEHEKYLKRRVDGLNMYLELCAETRVLKLNGVNTEEFHELLSAATEPVRNEIVLGQWEDGLRKLETIGSGVIGQAFYDRLHNSISEYITNNY